MKQQENNEIESLLRSWSGRRSSASTSGSATAQSSSAHMDVDELNAFAEGDLPTAARARYISHLVDCDDCRKIVGQLTVASGKVVAGPAVAAEFASPWWKQTLSALFAPSVLKFALPTLVLFAIGVVFFVSRQPVNQTANPVTTSNESSKATTAAGDTNSNASGVVAVNSTPVNNQPAKVTGSPAAGEKTTAKQQKNEDQSSATAEESETKTKAPEPAKETDSASAVQGARAAAQPAAEPAPPPPATAKPGNASPKDDAGTYANEALADKVERKREADKKRNDQETRAGDRAEGRDDDRQKAKNLGGVGAVATRRGENEPTRSVAGRKFYQRDGVWFDTAFKSGMAVTSVARGSEQYRALVSDEPEIATIANQLSGEIYVVWKSHGYHIK
ncbi:MAG TPA: hypothetical protein VGN86_02540 [Pyrinomonadaceae bacterium]|nr:hypothetical protein [Pyrinomonadaceae bacterium]